MIKTVSFLVFVVAVVAILNTNTVSGIKCFQCNSINNSACTNLETYTKSFLYPTLCGEEFQQDAFCRKTIIKVIEKNRVIEPRVIRSCGWIKHHKECYTADNEGHMEKVCQCFEDGCNSGSSIKPMFFIMPACIATIGGLFKVLGG